MVLPIEFDDARRRAEAMARRTSLGVGGPPVGAIENWVADQTHGELLSLEGELARLDKRISAERQAEQTGAGM